MPTTPGRFGRISASVALAAGVLAAAPSDLRAQDRMNAEARGWQRQSMETLQFERAQEEQRWRLEQARVA